jgi:hypothetical protein
MFMKIMIIILSLISLACGKSSTTQNPTILPPTGIYNLQSGQCNNFQTVLGDMQEQLSVQGNQMQIQDSSVIAGCMITTSSLTMSESNNETYMTGGVVTATKIGCTPSKTDNCQLTSCNMSLNVNGSQVSMGLPNFPIFLEGQTSYQMIGNTLVRTVNQSDEGNCTYTYTVQ